MQTQLERQLKLFLFKWGVWTVRWQQFLVDSNYLRTGCRDVEKFIIQFDKLYNVYCSVALSLLQNLTLLIFVRPCRSKIGFNIFWYCRRQQSSIKKVLLKIVWFPIAPNCCFCCASMSGQLWLFLKIVYFLSLFLIFRLCLRTENYMILLVFNSLLANIILTLI